MNHYPHHLGDYAKDTVGLSQGEHGAYLLLIFAAYSTEAGIDPEEVYAITKAATPAERKAADKVLRKYFAIAEDGLYHQKRIDQEISKYQIKAAKNREVGKAGGRPKRNPDGYQTETQTVSRTEPRPNPEITLASSQEPRTKPSDEQRYGDGDIPEAADAGRAVGPERQPHPQISLAEARIDSDDDTPAATLSAICIANGIRINPFHPLVIDWARDGVTVARMKDAIATARMRKPLPDKIPPNYLDTIIRGQGQKPPDARWRNDDTEAEKLCRELGIPGARVNEQRADWHNRIFEALRDSARRQVA